MLRERIDHRLVFQFVGEVHGFGGIVLLVVEFAGDDLRAVAFAPEGAAPAGVADAVAHDGASAGLAGVARVLADGDFHRGDGGFSRNGFKLLPSRPAGIGRPQTSASVG